MARLEKLLIHGIRSFGSEPNDRQVIDFKSPLTLILGRNGCGKTTIIEALKYATTGEMPFGQGAAFIHDPKLAREMEVKGQVKLELKTAEKKILTVTRSLQGLQKPKKLEVSTLDNVVEIKDPITKQKTSIPQKCADINELLVQTLGVAKPIISNVIFCHQEDSSWPLEEGKKLKERFDEIFDSTKHNRCLEEIRKLRKSILEETRTFKLELSHLRERREMVIQKRLQLEDVRRRYGETSDKINELNESLRPIEEEFQLWHKKQQNYAKVQSERENRKALYESLIRQQEELLQSIKEVFVGSKEDLEGALSDFKLQKEDKVMTQDRLEKQIARFRSSDDSNMRAINEAMNRRGELQAEISQQEQRICQRNEKLQRLCKACGFSGIDESPTESDIRTSLKQVKLHTTELDHKLSATRKLHDEEEKRLQKNVDAKRIKLSKLEQELKNKEDSIQAAKYDIKEKQRKLQEVDSSSNRLEAIEAEIDLYRGELEDVRGSVDEDSLKKEIAEHKDACRRLDEKQLAVNNEVKRLLVHSSNLNKLAELEKQEANLSATMRKLRNKNEEGINRLLSDSPEGSLKYELQSRLRTLEQKIKRDTQQITTRQREISGLTEQRRHKKDQLTQFETEVTAASEKIYGLCGRQPLETVISEEEDKLQALQDELGMISSSDMLYRRYISKLKQKNPCCPLCERGFDAELDALTLVQELNSKIISLPTRLEENKEKLQESKKKLSSLLEMRSTNQRMRNLQENVIPKLRDELSSLERDLDSKEGDLAVLQASLLAPQEDETLGRTMLADVAVMDQVHGDLKKVTVAMESIKKVLPSGGVSRTVEEAQAENDVLRDELTERRASREKLEGQLHKVRDTINRLEQEINRKVTEQLEIKSLVQQRVQLEERLQELSATVAVMENELEELHCQLRPTEAEMAAGEEMLQTARTSHRVELEEQSKEIARRKAALDEVSNLQTEITTKEERRAKEQLEEEEKEVSRLEKQRDEMKKRIGELDARLKSVIQEIADSDNKERDLHDNLQLHVKRAEAARLEKEVHRLKDEMGSLKLPEIMAKLSALAEQTSHITVQKNKAEGSCAELKANMEEKQRELQQDMFRLAEEKYKKKFLELKIHEFIEQDLQKFYVAYDLAMMEFHKKKMEQINGLIRELWQQIYQGNDIDYIEIRTDETKLSVTAQAEKRRIYNYRVVQIKNGTELDMRGRCSAGQKVLASLIIRMALAETFSLNCGILTLDEPTTNLDDANINSLSEAILDIVRQRMTNENFQLVVITHDPNFLNLLLRGEFISHYYKVERNHQGKSVIRTCDLDDRGQ